MSKRKAADQPDIDSTMGLTFYYSPQSTSDTTEWVLAELAIPHERIILDIRAADKPNEKADYLKLNPNGKVPMIIHDGVPIWESAAVNMYLGETFGVDAGLYPAPGPKRGEAMKWMVWSNVSLAEAVMRLMTATHGDKPEGKERAVADVGKLLSILNSGLEGRDWLLGAEYTLADTHLHATTSWAQMVGADMEPHPNLATWLKRCAERPAMKKLFQAAQAPK